MSLIRKFEIIAPIPTPQIIPHTASLIKTNDYVVKASPGFVYAMKSIDITDYVLKNNGNVVWLADYNGSYPIYCDTNIVLYSASKDGDVYIVYL